MHQSIPAAPIPLPRATAGHLPALSVPGVGHLQILRCPGAGELGSYRREPSDVFLVIESCFLILFEEHPFIFIKLFIAVNFLWCTINFNVNNFIT